MTPPTSDATSMMFAKFPSMVAVSSDISPNGHVLAVPLAIYHSCRSTVGRVGCSFRFGRTSMCLTLGKRGTLFGSIGVCQQRIVAGRFYP